MSVLARAALLGRYAVHMAAHLRDQAAAPELARLREMYLGPVRVGSLRAPRQLGRDVLARGRFAHAQQRPLLYLPFLSARPFHEPGAHAAALERHAAEIADEYRRIEAWRAAHPEARLLASGAWSVLRLYRGGVKHADNCARCPATTAAIERLPLCWDHLGMAYFSVLEPGTRIKPHCGPTNARIRLHLGIDVPPGARIRVGRAWRTWEAGRCLVFDDSFEHEVEHRGTQRRVVLVVDVWHPELTAAERAALSSSVLRTDMDRVL